MTTRKVWAKTVAQHAADTRRARAARPNTHADTPGSYRPQVQPTLLALFLTGPLDGQLLAIDQPGQDYAAALPPTGTDTTPSVSTSLDLVIYRAKTWSIGGGTGVRVYVPNDTSLDAITAALVTHALSERAQQAVTNL